MPPKRFEGKFGIPSSHEPESLLTSALYRLPESGEGVRWAKEFSGEIASRVNTRNILEQRSELTEDEVRMLTLKLARHYEDNGESAPIDIATCVDALIESPKFLRNDKGSITKLFELHEMKTLQKIAELRRKRAEITAGDAGELNPYENLFETTSGEYYLARLLNMPHLEEESTYMNHCVGTSDSYVNKMKRGEVEILSLRSTQTHEPVVTIEYDAKSQTLLQVKGKSDRIPTLDDWEAFDLLEALSRLPETINDNGEHRLVKSNEVAHLTRLLAIRDKMYPPEYEDEEPEDAQELTRDDLLFLYEVNEPIEGFDVAEREPLIDELLNYRNIEDDIVTITGCDPEHLVRSFTQISESTEVCCVDTGQSITFIDFREEKNKAKLPYFLELAQKLKETGSLAQLDLSFEGGIVSIEFDVERVKDRKTACKSFTDADGGSPPHIWEGWTWNSLFLYTVPEANPFVVMVFSYDADVGIRISSEKIIADMDALGFRPLTLEEMMIAGIQEPKFTKTENRSFVGLTKYDFGGTSDSIPVLFHSDGVRCLGKVYVGGTEWGDACRFLCVRKS